MSMKSTLTKRSISALTLFSFTLTTISPSLAWAAEQGEREEVRTAPGAAAAVAAPAIPVQGAAARVVDAVPATDLEASREKPTNLPENATAAAPKLAPSKDDLKQAVGGAIEKSVGTE